MDADSDPRFGHVATDPRFKVQATIILWQTGSFDVIISLT